jgi:hypothetical protein
VELARIEARADARRGLVAGGLGAVAALALSIAAACAAIAAVDGLGRVMPRWLAALAGCALFFAVGALFATLATVQVRAARPDRTLRAARDTARALAVETEVTRLREECRAMLVELERRADRLIRVPRAVARVPSALRAHPVALVASLAVAAGILLALHRR